MKPSVYLPGLNGVRFIAAALVVIDHVEEFKGHFGLRSFGSETFNARLGAAGVTIFFALSGYLITYLLLVERKVTQAIDVKNFYVRRILRIWPIYYLLVLSAFAVFPHIPAFDIPPTPPRSTSSLAPSSRSSSSFFRTWRS